MRRRRGVCARWPVAVPPTKRTPGPPALLDLLPCRLIREFEREARTDGMPANELNFRKKQYVQELNGFIGLKKAYSGAAAQRSELLEGAKSETEKLSSAL